MPPRVLKLVIAIASVATLAIVCEPVVRDPADDGYPLSTYPMFAARRPTVLTVDYAYGLGAGGARVPIPPYYVGSREVLQARAILEQGVHRGPKAAADLCGAIAQRVAGADQGELAGVTAIHVVTGTHDAVDYLVRDRPGREITRAVCQVVRR